MIDEIGTTTPDIPAGFGLDWLMPSWTAFYDIKVLVNILYVPVNGYFYWKFRRTIRFWRNKRKATDEELIEAGRMDPSEASDVSMEEMEALFAF